VRKFRDANPGLPKSELRKYVREAILGARKGPSFASPRRANKTHPPLPGGAPGYPWTGQK
jgi:hypothetical protein